MHSVFFVCIKLNNTNMAAEESRSDKLKTLGNRVRAYEKRYEDEGDALSEEISAFLPLYEVVASTIDVESGHAMQLAVFSTVERADAFAGSVISELRGIESASAVKVGVRSMREVSASSYPRRIDITRVDLAVHACTKELTYHELGRRIHN